MRDMKGLGVWCVGGEEEEEKFSEASKVVRYPRFSRC